MASSGSFTTTEYEGRSLTFSWSIQSQSVADNTTTISWNLKGSGSYTYGWVSCGGFKVVINGSTVYTKSTDYRLNVYSGDVIASGTHTIAHNSDGSKTFSASAQAGIYTYAVNCSGSGSWALTTIPRASSFGTISGNTIGSNMTVNITRNSSSFTHQLLYKLGSSQWYDLGKNIGTSTTFTISNDLLSQLPSATSGTLQLCVRTYNGGTQIGSDVYKNVTVYVNNSVVPTIGTITLTPQTYSQLIQGKNKLTISVSGCSAGTGSSIKSYTFSGPGISTTTTSTSATSSLVSSAGTLTYTVTVTDNRGRTASGTQTIVCYAYAAPTIKSFDVYRSNSDRTKNDDGKYITWTLNNTIVYSSVKNTNSVTIKLTYKNNANASDTKTTTVMTNATTLQGAGVVGEIGSGTYSVYLTITDAYGGTTTTASQTVFGAFRTVNIVSDGTADNTGMAFGKKATPGVFDVRWPIKTDSSVTAPGGIVAGSSTQSSAPTNGIQVHDVRSATITPNSFGDKNANFYFQQINSKWNSVMHVKGWSDNYAAWELAGNAHNTSNDNSLRYRQGVGTTWGEWQTVFTNKNYTNYTAPKPVTLYNNSSGSTGTITLSDSAANYSYFEIFLYKDSASGWWSVKVPSPNGKIAQVGTQYYTAASSVGIQLIGKTVTISATTITPGTEFYMNFHSSETRITALGGQTSVKIMRVDGYK